jgi:hypothetical protein
MTRCPVDDCFCTSPSSSSRRRWFARQGKSRYSIHTHHICGSRLTSSLSDAGIISSQRLTVGAHQNHARRPLALQHVPFIPKLSGTASCG